MSSQKGAKDESNSTTIRKLRKKLRQIENLERLQRQLTDDELAKIYQKEELRKELNLKLADLPLKDSKNRAPKVQIADQSIKQKSIVDQSVRPRSIAEQSIKPKSPVATKVNTGDINEEQIVQDTVSKKSPAETVAPVKKKIKEVNSWIGRQFQVRYLKGHADVITCIVVDRDILVTGSRDTTLKLWDAVDGNLTISMGGHTGPVTSLVMIPADDPRFILDSDQEDTVGHGRKVISGSTDCSLRIWALDTGLMLTRLYTYSPVQCVSYRDGIVATGSDAGKVELWDLDKKESLCSIISFNEELLTSVLFCEENHLAASSVTGLIKVWEITNHTLTIQASSEEASLWKDGKMVSTEYSSNCRVNSMVNRGNKLYWGDENRNIKVFDYHNAKIYKLTNNLGEICMTDCLTSINSLLISSSYDLDSGLSYLNVRKMEDDEYLCSIDEGSTERVMSISCTFYKDSLLRICTGGSYELRIWDQLDIKKDIKESSWIVEGFRHSLGMQVGDLSSANCIYHDNFNTVIDSESESDSDVEDTISDSDELTEEASEVPVKNESNSFCLIL